MYLSQFNPVPSRLVPIPGPGGKELSTAEDALPRAAAGREMLRRARRTPSAAGPSVTLPPTESDQQSRVSMGAEPTRKIPGTDPRDAADPSPGRHGGCIVEVLAGFFQDDPGEGELPFA